MALILITAVCNGLPLAGRARAAGVTDSFRTATWLSQPNGPDWLGRGDGNNARTTNFGVMSLDGHYGVLSVGSVHPSSPGGSDSARLYLADTRTRNRAIASTNPDGSLAGPTGIIPPPDAARSIFESFGKRP